jgi:alpha-1,6-mannosyltransferase
LVLAGVIFRAEIALLLFTQLGHLLVRSRVSLQTIIPAGLGSALAALAVSVPLDSYLWQRPIWPELAGFYYNAIEGKSADWGTSPYFYYFNTLIPGLLNPLMLMVLIPLSFLIPATRYSAREFIEPSAFFVAIYSLQPHKESRFIIYIVPALTATAALSASYISTRRSKSLFYQLGSLLIALAVMVCFAASTLKLLISSLNYPGGEALSTLHSLLNQNSSLIPTVGGQGMVRIHMDVLSCMTGISRFQQYPSVAFDTEGSLALDYVPEIAGVPTLITYDKTEESDKLLDPKLWNTFDFALMEDPGKAIGAWETIGVIYAYAGIEFLRPGQDSAVRDLEAIYEANNLTTEDNKTLGSQDIRDKVEELKEVKTARTEARSLGELKETLLGGNLSRYQIYRLVKDATRSVTGGWWIGPRMEPKISILRRIKDPR